MPGVDRHRLPRPLRRWPVALAALALAACAHEAPRHLGPGPKLPEQKARVRRTVSPPEWYWEAVEIEPSEAPPKPLDVPVAETGIRRIEGAARLWDELPAEARGRLRRDGVLVLGSDVGMLEADDRRGSSFGAFYMNVRDQRLPHVVTLDALFALTHVGLIQALADVEDADLAPALQSFLEKVEARLGAEQAGVGTELAGAYRIARGVISVARALGAQARYAPPRDIATDVNAERELIEGAAGVAQSPILGIPIDYARFAAPDGAARPGLFRALAWLGAAPLTIVARSEAAGSTVGTMQARTNARAAMLLSRVRDHDVDPAIHATYTRIQRLLAFVWGASDDLSLTELDDVADAAGIDLTNPNNIANVVRVDRVRQRALAGRPPAIYDGAGGVSVRVFGGHAAEDSTALQALVQTRGLPSSLDVAAWLGAPEAMSLAREAAGGLPDGYEPALKRAQERRQAVEDGALHASVHGSYVDALIAWANETPVTGIARTAPADKMRVDSLLAGWTLARRVDQPLARPKHEPPRAPAELRVSGQPLPVMIEAAPDVIARLVALVRQIRRGLGALGPLAPTSPSAAALAEIEDILRIALTSAQHVASDVALTPEETTALASLPARMARLEDDAGDGVGPTTAVVFHDSDGRRVLASATTKIEPVLLLARLPGSDEPLLLVGAHLGHDEIVDKTVAPGHRPATVADIHPALAPPAAASRSRAPWTAAFRWTR